MRHRFVIFLFLFVTGPVFAQSQTQVAVTDEYIVKYKNKISLHGLKVGSEISQKVSIKKFFANSRLLHVRVGSHAARAALFANPDVEFVEPNYILSVNPLAIGAPVSTVTSRDSYSQSGSNAQVNKAWEIEKPFDQGTKTIVAVLDTGLDSEHPLFLDSNSQWENLAEKNGSIGVDDDGNGFIDDFYGWNFARNNNVAADDNNHGTHVAGIILGVGQDVFESPAREAKIKIMALKILDSTGSGLTSAAISAIFYAVDNGARIINNSWAVSSYSKALAEAYTYASDNDVVIVSAAGNLNGNNDVTAIYPSNLDSPNNISVAAVTDADIRASFSNYGELKVSVAAPGVDIISSVTGSGCGIMGCFQTKSGTSMAAPFVAGIAALVAREAPQLSANQIKNLIIASVDVVSSLSDKVLADGRVNVYKAILSAKNPLAFSVAPAAVPRQYSAGGGGGGMLSGCGSVKMPGGSSRQNAVRIIMELLMFLLPLLLLKLKQNLPQTPSAIRWNQLFCKCD